MTDHELLEAILQELHEIRKRLVMQTPWNTSRLEPESFRLPYETEKERPK